MRYNRVAIGYRSEAACTTCRAHLSHPITDGPVVSVVSLFHSIPFHSIPVPFHLVHSSELSRSSQTGEGGGRADGVSVCTRCDLVWSSHSAPSVTIPFHSIPFHLTFHSVPCFPSTPTVVSAHMLALVQDSLDSADGLGVESTLDSFRRVVASIQRQADQADGHPDCSDVIAVKAIHPRP